MSKGKQIVFVLSISRPLHGKTIDFGKEKPQMRKPCACLKNDSDISSTFSYDFSWDLAKVLTHPHVQQRSLNGLASSMQLKIKMFFGTVLLLYWLVTKVERRFTGTGQKRKYQLHMANCHTKTEKNNAPKSN